MTANVRSPRRDKHECAEASRPISARLEERRTRRRRRNREAHRRRGEASQSSMSSTMRAPRVRITGANPASRTPPAPEGDAVAALDGLVRIGEDGAQPHDSLADGSGPRAVAPPLRSLHVDVTRPFEARQAFEPAGEIGAPARSRSAFQSCTHVRIEIVVPVPRDERAVDRDLATALGRALSARSRSGGVARGADELHDRSMKRVASRPCPRPPRTRTYADVEASGSRVAVASRVAPPRSSHEQVQRSRCSVTQRPCSSPAQQAPSDGNGRQSAERQFARDRSRPRPGEAIRMTQLLAQPSPAGAGPRRDQPRRLGRRLELVEPAAEDTVRTRLADAFFVRRSAR